MRRRSVAALLLSFCLLCLAAGCGQEIKREEEGDTQYVIGVAAYDPDSAEMQMFINYYRDYIAEGFPVEFFFSDRLNSVAEEQAFIRSMKQKGADGIISFYGTDIVSVLETCAQEELYYVLGSGTVDDETFEQVKDYPYFLGTIGPRPEAERQAGADMASYFWDLGARRFLVLSGGASQGNYMHYARVQGMLETLAEKSGGAYDSPVDELASVSGNRVVYAGEAQITISSGYYTQEEGKTNVDAALADGDYDAVLCAYNIDNVVPQIAGREAEVGHSIRTGTVDCFSERNFEIIKQRDVYGNPQIDYIEGKYASMAGPAFAALYNAMSGNWDVISPDGGAFRLYQGFWTARSPEEYMELYGYTTGIYENAYSCFDLMQIIQAFQEDANFDSFQALTEAYDVESVKARILAQENLPS